MALCSPGCGYAVSWEMVTQKPIRRWSKEARARVRRRNLQQRIEKKFPLFAAIFIADEIKRCPEYFDGADL
jgi:hypothetical protein